MVYDIAIIGGGPAGIAAALTASNQGLHCLLLGDRRGGQLADITRLTNWFDDGCTDGKQLTDLLYDRLNGQESYITVKRSSVTVLRTAAGEKGGKLFAAELQDGGRVLAKALIIATGTRQKQLGIPGEQALLGKGVSYCATCDIPYFKSKTVALICNGDHAFTTADDLARQAAQVYLLTPDLGKPRAKNVRVIKTAQVERIIGKGRVSGLVYRDSASKQAVRLAVDGVFIECGVVGNSVLVSHFVDVDEDGFVKVDHATMRSSLAGIYAAGDIANGRYKQVSLAMADGTKAALSARQYLSSKEVV